MSQTVDTTALAPEPPPKTESHPPGLYALFTTEMWERFSYYGMRALLTLYLMKAIGYQEDGALEIYAIYTGLAYLTPLFGGRIADLYLGQRKAVFVGGILMALGQFTLMRPDLLSLGLGLMILGNGFFKPNISVMVGSLYAPDDLRRDGAYTLFYMGINLGAAISPWVTGYLANQFGWGYGFAAAGVGMILGLFVFLFTQRTLQGVGLPPGREATPRATLTFRDWIQVTAVAASLAVAVYGAIEVWPTIRFLWSPSWLPAGFASFAYKAAILVGIVVLFLLATERKADEEMEALHQPFTAADWQRLGVIVVMSLFSVLFWMGFEQSGGTLNIFADQKVDRVVFGREVTTEVFQSINPIFIIVLASAFAALWTSLARRGVRIPSVAKQGVGLMLLGLALVVMYYAEQRAGVVGRVSPLWLVAVYFIFTVAELFVSPIGLSLANKLSHPRIASLMMAFWFLCTAAANYMAGIVKYEIVQPNGYNLWIFLAAMSFFPGLLLLALTPVLVKMSHGRV
ncbi:peptide MFS transporter [Paludisphaera mucosa]|uniref:Peptide MFS transporter n=1 Tax=Paludisphaera mucosa TaxID=3030827 RepID=A0ABT6F7Z4_9BACT|nr:peptide MFS transporter [Paludisphaera mucosa]MDG3003693.1 peptide MFS transporter [Paludisphaera mucosa]